MALTIKDIMELPSGSRMQVLAGAGGLSRPVVSVGILDYEFSPGLMDDVEQTLEPGSILITSFLFAKDQPELILQTIEKLPEFGIAGLAYKPVFYEELPPEVLSFAKRKDFPLLLIPRDLWFENIIFDIMYAVQFDDKVYLSEEKIDNMLARHMTRPELDIILKGISLKLRPFVSVVYISAGSTEPDIDRILHSFYMSKGFREKALIVRYEDSLFLIMTSSSDDFQKYLLILKEARELFSIADTVRIGMSSVCPVRELDRAFREAWHAGIAARCENLPQMTYRKSGIYRLLLPALQHPETAAFAESILKEVQTRPDLLETALAYTSCGGDIATAAGRLHCHQNTVRYRLGKIREVAGLTEVTDAELYLQLRLAMVISTLEQRY